MELDRVKLLIGTLGSGNGAVVGVSDALKARSKTAAVTFDDLKASCTASLDTSPFKFRLISCFR